MTVAAAPLAILLAGCGGGDPNDTAASVHSQAANNPPPAAVAAAAVPSLSSSQAPSNARIAYDRYSLMIEGQRVILNGGEVHYNRMPLWRDNPDERRATIKLRMSRQK
ncbi:hypothetical protein [Caballeronia insecticola]|uniref:hypothetical protein n=1 Tax=Caballeronia insecticola TaxID=758793 RepID=UPI0011828EAC|nr:hypothetical protein [Caballeronia insecticola]